MKDASKISNKIHPWNTKALYLFSFILASSTLIFFCYLYWHKPFYTELRGWFFRYKVKEINSHLSLLYSFLACFILPIIFYKNKKTKFRLLSIYFVGVSLQFSFAFIEGNGIYPIFKNIHAVGHKEFSHLALKVDSAYEVITNYDHVKKLTNDGFIESKPPGSLLFYYATKKISQFLFPFVENSSRALYFMQILASFIWPFFSMLVLLPLYFLTKLFFKKEVALTSCLFFIFLPMTNLVTMHLDQVVFPLLFTTSLLIASLGSTKENNILIFLAGVLTYISVFFTFGLLALFPFIFFIYLLTSKSLTTSLKNLVLTSLGFILSYLFMFYFMNYNTYENYQSVISHSQGWEYSTTMTFRRFWKSGLVNFFEFGSYLGLPILFIFIISNIIDLKSIFQFPKTKKLPIQVIFSLGTALIIFLMHLIQRNTAEVIRLWLFTTTMIAITCSVFLHKFHNKHQLKMSTLIISLQWLCILIIKLRNDF